MGANSYVCRSTREKLVQGGRGGVCPSTLSWIGSTFFILVNISFSLYMSLSKIMSTRSSARCFCQCPLLPFLAFSSFLNSSSTSISSSSFSSISFDISIYWYFFPVVMLKQRFRTLNRKFHDIFTLLWYN